MMYLSNAVLVVFTMFTLAVAGSLGVPSAGNLPNQFCAESDSMLMMPPSGIAVDVDDSVPIAETVHVRKLDYLSLLRDDAQMDDGDFKQSDLKKYFLAEFDTMSNETKDKLKEIRESCRKIKVLISGMPRSGSTSLFTIAHIMLFFCDENYTPPSESQSSLYIDDPNNCDESAPAPKFCWNYFNDNVSGILKTHLAVPDRRTKFPDVILFSHRKPDEMMVSMWLSFFSSCDAPPCKDWRNGMHELERQACLYESFDSNTIKYDMALESLNDNPILVMSEVAVALGLMKGPLEQQELMQHALRIYDKVNDDIQHGRQVSHHSGDEQVFRAVAQEMFRNGCNYTVPLMSPSRQDEHFRDGELRDYYSVDPSYKGQFLSINGLQWLEGSGDAASNPFLKEVNVRVGDELRHNYQVDPIYKGVKDAAVNNPTGDHPVLEWCSDPAVVSGL